MQMSDGNTNSDFIRHLCEEFKKHNILDPEYYEKFNVKRGLRNADGTGVMAGCTLVCNVHGYLVNEGEKMPIDGELIYRGINVKDLIRGCIEEDRFGFEEVIYLLLFGDLPTTDQLSEFTSFISEARELPDNFIEDVVMKIPSRDIMNKMARAVLSMYSYDENPEDLSLENVMRQSIALIASFPMMAVSAYQVKKRYFDKKSLFFHFPKGNLSTAENILYTLRSDKQFTREEAKLLDICLMLHAEHGGGNNSTFTTRVLTSSGTDTYSAIAGGISSLKGPKHGGANARVIQMLSDIQANVKHWDNDDEVLSYLEKIIRKEAGDGSGLIYGMGHAVYTLSDPRAVILKQNASNLAEKAGMLEELNLIKSVERLAPIAFKNVKNDTKVISANVDLYSGFVYKLLNIPEELCTPLFAIARVVGWSAHRIEELTTGGRIIRPAYKTVAGPKEYVPLEKR